MPLSPHKLSYESFLEIIRWLNKADTHKRSSPTNIKAIVTEMPKDGKIFSFDFKREVLSFTDIRKPFEPKKVCPENYTDIMATIWQESVYLMVGREPTCYLPFKTIAEKSIADLSAVVKTSEVISTDGIQGMILEYALDADRLAEAAEKLGFFKSPTLEKSDEIASGTVPHVSKHSF